MDLCGSKRLAFVALVPGLSADGPLRARRHGWQRRFSYIAGRRRGEILGQPGHLRRKFAHSFGKIRGLLLQRRDGGITLGKLMG